MWEKALQSDVLYALDERRGSFFASGSRITLKCVHVGESALPKKLQLGLRMELSWHIGGAAPASSLSYHDATTKIGGELNLRFLPGLEILGVVATRKVYVP